MPFWLSADKILSYCNNLLFCFFVDGGADYGEEEKQLGEGSVLQSEEEDHRSTAECWDQHQAITGIDWCSIFVLEKIACGMGSLHCLETADM